MKTEKLRYSVISAFLIVSFITPPLFLAPHKASAQNYPISIPSTSTPAPQSGAGYSFGSGVDNAQGIPSGPSDSAAPSWKEKSCGALLGGGIKNLFGASKKATLGKATKVGTDRSAAALDKKIGDSVPTFDERTYNLTYGIKQQTDAIQIDTNATNKKLNCWDSIAKIMMKIVIRKVTLSIIDWINHGYEGKPFFLENPAGFFKDIAKNEFLTFSAEIGNPLLFPFGRNFLAGAVMAFQNKFAANARYSLDELIAKTNVGKTRVDFNANFNVGGWDAWLGMTAPQNNPIGFGIMASNELAIRLEGTQQSKATQTQNYLLQSGGFLGDERCADPKGVTHEEDAKARAGEINEYVPWRECKRWEYVTPGKLIAERITFTQNSSQRSLEMADDINSALAAIADAALNQFITNYSNKGLKALTNQGNTESFNISSNFSPSSTGTPFPEFYVSPGSWISHHLDFDMKTDVTQAFIDEQRTYSSKLSSYSDALAETIMWIRQLDYCIPGPNPDWEEKTAELVSGIGGVKTSGKNGWELTSEILAFSSLAAAIPGAGTWIALGGTLASIGAGFAGTAKAQKENKNAAADAVERLLEVNIYDGQDQMVDQGGVNALMNNVFNEYQRKIRKIYFTGSPVYMPGVTAEGRSLFQNIAGYEQIIKNNYEEIIFRKSTVTRLQALKQKIDDLNGQLQSGQITGTQYENNFGTNAPLVTEFSRLSAYFVDGDDIANIDNLAKESMDDKKYIHDDLLAGPFGCEKEMSALWSSEPSHITYNTYVRRQPYPFPIHHLYAGSWSATGPWEDPWSQTKYEAYNLNPNEGFLFGSTYFNGQAGHGDINCPEYDQYAADGNTTSTEDAATGGSGATPSTHLSLPNSTSSGTIQDIGGLSGSGDLPNNCGVVTRGFEKTFMVY